MSGVSESKVIHIDLDYLASTYGIEELETAWIEARAFGKTVLALQEVRKGVKE